MENEVIIANIVTTMSTVLSPAQLQMLETTLTSVFTGVECTYTGKKTHRKTKIWYINAFINAKKIEGCSPRTLHHYGHELRRFVRSIKKVDIRTITTEDVRAYLSNQQKNGKCGLVTIDNTRRILSSFFKWLEEEDIIIKSPMTRIHHVKLPRKIRKEFTEEEVERIRDVCSTSIRNLAIVELLYTSGIRVGELVKLNRSSINLTNRSCIVTGKGNAQREVYFDTATKIHLLAYLETRSDKNPALFLTQKRGKKRLSIGGVERMLSTIGKKAEVQNVHPHRFRRTMATRAISKGLHIEMVQKLLGHISIDTTLHYANVNQEKIRTSYLAAI